MNWKCILSEKKLGFIFLCSLGMLGIINIGEVFIVHQKWFGLMALIIGLFYSTLSLIYGK
jgi:hypothetical protein